MNKRVLFLACVCSLGLSMVLPAEAWQWWTHSTKHTNYDLVGDLTGTNGYWYDDEEEGEAYGEYGCDNWCTNSVGPAPGDTWTNDQLNTLTATWTDFLDQEGARTFDGSVSYYQNWYSFAAPSGPVMFSIMYITRINKVTLSVDGIAVAENWLGVNTNNVQTMNIAEELQIEGENGTEETPIVGWSSSGTEVAKGGFVDLSAEVRTIIDYGLTHHPTQWSSIHTHGHSMIGVTVGLD